MGIVGMSKAIALDMERFGVRSNCLAPFAYTRMVSSIPTDTSEGAEGAERADLIEGEKRLWGQLLSTGFERRCAASDGI
jgi:NAD(P)-dependent dehydrogenase (short-subunit alcohol dehydrogenase family)